MKKRDSVLGKVSPEAFFQEYWHKRPLLIRHGVDPASAQVSKETLFELAADESVQSRLITYQNQKWTLRHGPFRRQSFKPAKSYPWTLLVQEVNCHLPAVDQLLRQFSFVPYARLDDIMISYAEAGGGVGAHFDSYDVFLIQMSGHKRWRISAQADQTFIKDAPIRVLQQFEHEDEYILAPGDILYLPPQYAHEGVALDEGMTYSVGFRAPSYQECVSDFLVYLDENLQIEGQYADADLCEQAHPATVPEQMIQRLSQFLNQHLVWTEEMVADFIGKKLSEPSLQTWFEPVEQDYECFVEQTRQKGILLNLKTRLLLAREKLYCNGEAWAIEKQDVANWQLLADDRKLAGENISKTMLDELFQGYVCGYWGNP